MTTPSFVFTNGYSIVYIEYRDTGKYPRNMVWYNNATLRGKGMKPVLLFYAIREKK